MESPQEILGWRGWSATDSAGETLGSVAEIYLEPGTEEPNWILLDLKGFRVEPAFVPAELCEAAGEGIVVRQSRDHVRDAPRPSADGRLSAAEAAELRAYYGIAPSD